MNVSMRPLARWTIGPVNDLGFDILEHSIECFQRVYPEFDLILCHNHLGERDLDYGIQTLEQTSKDVCCDLREPDGNPEEASGCGWKLSPPRIRMDSHELWIDNDLVIRERLTAIDDWLERKDAGLISAGVGRCRMYGEFDNLVQDGLFCCAGLFGLPPGFDFAKKISDYSRYAKNPIGGYDEQGMTVAIVTSMESYVLVPLEQLWISEDHKPFPSEMPRAIHFAGANRKHWHRGWKSYLWQKSGWQKFRWL